jgi:diguanylate cyclase (GGDEF)-like protein/PAS domain S-box-containing protein
MNTDVIQGLENALTGKSVDVIDYEYDIPETGKRGWASNRIAPLYNTNHEIIGVLESVLDITDRKLAEQALINSEARHKAMTMNITDVIAILDQKGIIRYISPNIEYLFGFTPEEVIDQPAARLVHANDRKVILKKFIELLAVDGLLKHMEFEHLCKNGSCKCVELTAINLFNNKDINGVLMNYHDVTFRKMKEREVIYLSYHDALTGLYNRAFFEEEIRRLDVPRQYPISLIIADINGLKVANDTLGHSYGDRLLGGFAGVIKSCLRKEDIIARWGGDEFIALLPRTTYDVAMQLCDRIKKQSNDKMIGHQAISVALGYATKDDENQCFMTIIKDAEDQMYKMKLLEARSRRSETVSSLLKTLYEMNYETEEHDQRLLEIVTQIGNKLGLMPQEIEELRLLAVLHDIGKLGISKELIMKPGKLTDDEFKEVKRHSEIGYRIAESTPGLLHVAKYILSVHERWDGTGYPQKIKGNAIPKLSRIVAIIDAYDAMISGRPYKKAITHQEAIQEILRCSVTQFDPYLAELFVSPDVSGNINGNR